MSGKLKIHQMYSCTMEQKTFQVEQTKVQMKEDSMKVQEIPIGEVSEEEDAGSNEGNEEGE